MTKLPVIAKPDKDVICTRLENQEAVLLHLGRQTYFSLNRTGVSIWRQIEKGKTLAEIGEELSTEFDMDAVEAEQNVLEFARTLAENRLVSLA